MAGAWIALSTFVAQHSETRGQTFREQHKMYEMLRHNHEMTLIVEGGRDIVTCMALRLTYSLEHCIPSLSGQCFLMN
jgi:hypothetical protein